nr:kinesin-like protein KIN-12B [Tanacetum cinerariifolium]
MPAKGDTGLKRKPIDDTPDRPFPQVMNLLKDVPSQKRAAKKAHKPAALSSAGLFSPPKLDLSNSGLEEFQQPEFEGYGSKTSNSVSEDISNEVKEIIDYPLVKELVSYDKPKAVSTARSKAVDTARPSPTVVNAVRENLVNDVKASALQHQSSSKSHGQPNLSLAKGKRKLNEYLTVLVAHNPTNGVTDRLDVRYSASCVNSRHKYINLLTSQRRIEGGILDVKKAAAKAGVKSMKSKFINALAAEILTLKEEREKERLRYRDKNKGLQA